MRTELLRRVAAGERFAGLLGSATPTGLRLTVPVARPGGMDLLDADLPAGASSYPRLTPDLPAAFWYERALHDLFGVIPEGHPRLDPLVLPLLEDDERPRPGSADYPAVIVPSEAALPRLVGGAGLFTIPHGPVRSGVFESVEYVIETPVRTSRICPFGRSPSTAASRHGSRAWTPLRRCCWPNGSRASRRSRTPWPTRTPSSRWRLSASRRPPSWSG